MPDGAISKVEMESVITLAQTTEAFKQALRTWSTEVRPDKTTRARAILERLQDYTEDQVPITSIRPILTAFSDVADELIAADPKRQTMFDMGVDLYIGRLYWQLIRRLPQADRVPLLRDIFATGQALQHITREVMVFGQEHGKFSTNKRSQSDDLLFTTEQLAELEHTVLQRIQAAAQDGSLRTYTSFPSLLYAWSEWANAEEPREWVAHTTASDEGLLSFVEAFLSESMIESLEEVHRIHRQPRLDPESMRPFLDPDTVIERLRTLAEKANITDRQQAAVRQFIIEYDARHRGIDPNDPFVDVAGLVQDEGNNALADE